MTRYFIKRALLFVPTMFILTLVLFVIMRIVPGDPVLLVLVGQESEASFTQAEYDAVAKMLGTDKPLHIQYLTWIWGVVRGDFGTSFYFNKPVMDDLKARAPITLELAILSILISFLVAVPIGVITAVAQDTWIDYAGKLFTVAGVALPTFWVAILVVYLLTQWFNWLPALGYATLWGDPWTNIQQLIFPALALGYHNMAFTARVTRSSMLEVLRDDYIRTARAKGLTESLVVGRHALKNAFLPVITITGFQFAGLMGGTVLVETIFVVPGLGSALINAIHERDLNLIQAIIFLTGGIVVTLNLLVDVIYGWLDPRIRYA